MTATPSLQPSPPDPATGFPVRRVAGLHLRSRAGPERSRVYWPVRPGSTDAPVLLVLFSADGVAADALDLLCRGLCSAAGVVVLAVSGDPVSDAPYEATKVREATKVLEWAADHAAQLGADPGRIVVAGAGAGGDLAAAVAAHVRDVRWPVIAGQVLRCPDPGALRAGDPGATAAIVADLARAVCFALADATGGVRSTHLPIGTKGDRT